MDTVVPGRRLSLATSLIAKPKVLYLDEPSTGLDPETRQGFWEIVSALRPGRCIVLTTHSMEEADALCSRIGIMTNGALRCIGTPLHLKNKFGAGYQLTLTLAADGSSISERRAKVHKLVETEVTKDAVPVETFKDERVLEYIFSGSASTQVSKIFTLMQDPRLKQLNVAEWSVAQASLNDVFVRIVKESEAEAELAKGRASKGAPPEVFV
jgi:ABC-type multidrug transport system ATPase subunit